MRRHENLPPPQYPSRRPCPRRLPPTHTRGRAAPYGRPSARSGSRGEGRWAGCPAAFGRESVLAGRFPPVLVAAEVRKS